MSHLVHRAVFHPCGVPPPHKMFVEFFHRTCQVLAPRLEFLPQMLGMELGHPGVCGRMFFFQICNEQVYRILKKIVRLWLLDIDD